MASLQEQAEEGDQLFAACWHQRESKVDPVGSWIRDWLLTQLASNGEKNEHLLCTTGEQSGLLMGIFKLQAVVVVELYPLKKDMSKSSSLPPSS